MLFSGQHPYNEKIEVLTSCQKWGECQKLGYITF